MDEPFLGPSLSGQIYRKADYPILSLISSIPRRRSSPRASDPFSPRSYQPLSPSTFQTYSPSALQSDEQGSSGRPEFYVGSAPSPCFARPDLIPRAASFRGREYSGVGSLHQIPEDPLPSTGDHQVSFGKAAAAEWGQEDEPDLEASSSVEEWNYCEGNDDNTGVVRDPLTVTVDSEEGNGEKQSWAAFLISALPSLPSAPDVLKALSSPEQDFLCYVNCENTSDNPEQPEHYEDTHERSGLSKLFSSSCSSLASLSLPRPLSEMLTDAASLSTEQLLDQPAAVSPSKGDSEAPSVSGPDGCNFKPFVDRRCKRTNMHRAKTAPMLTGLGKLHTKVECNSQLFKAPKPALSSVVLQASIVLCIYLTAGVIIYTWKKDEFSGVETMPVVDAIYFCIVTMCTIGYGDITPITPSAKLLACALMFVGFGFIDFLLSGLVTIVLDRQECFLLTVVKDGHHERAKNYVMDAKKGRMRIRMKVALAVCTVLMTVLVGVFFLRFIEGLKWVDALYVTCISITTVGYGDFSFQTMWGRLFAAVWLLLSTLGVARAFLFLAEARVHSRHRHLAKRILEQKMTTNDLMTMDLDNDGHVSKSEFVVYKLKEMGKINEVDVLEICKQFDSIDNMAVGKITLAQLLEADR